MARRQRRPLSAVSDGRNEACLEDLWQIYVATAIHLNGGSRFGKYDMPAFAPRVLIRPGLWRIPEPEDPDAFEHAYNRGLLTRPALRERLAIMAKNKTTSDGPFPSSPYRPTKYSVRFDVLGKLAIHGFCQFDPARVFIERVLGDAQFRWQNDNAIYVEEMGMTISCSHLEDIMESTGSFRLPAPYPRMADQIAGRYSGPSALEDSDEEVTPRKTRVRRQRAPEDAKQPRSKRDGLTPIATIAAELSLDPSKVRAKLRKLGIEKPAAGWNWAPDEVPALLEKLR